MQPRERALFSADELLTYSWRKTKEHLRPLVTIGATGAALALLERASQGSDRWAAAGLLSLVVQLFQLAITMAWIRIALDICDGKPVGIPRLKTLWPDFLMFLITSMLAGIVVALGFVALVLPGVWLLLAFGFAGFLVIDQRLSPGAALRESARLTRGRKAELFGLAAVFFLLNIGGALLFGVGLLLTVPMSFIASARVFRRLQELPARAQHQPAPEGTLLAHGGRP